MFLGFRICFVVLIPFIVLVNTVLEVYAIREELGPKSLEDLVASPSLPLPPSSLSPPRLVSGPSLSPDKLSLFYGEMRKRHHTLWQYGISPKGLLSCREIQQRTLGRPWWC